MDSKFEKCIFIRYKDGLNGYKLWNPITRKVVQPKEPEKIEFELKEEELDSTVEEESEDKEPQNPGVRRSV